MKIERKEKEFQPITITLETELEARVLMTLAGNVRGIDDPVGEIALDIRHALWSLDIKGFYHHNPSFHSGSVDLKGEYNE